MKKSIITKATVEEKIFDNYSELSNHLESVEKNTNWQYVNAESTLFEENDSGNPFLSLGGDEFECIQVSFDYGITPILLRYTALTSILSRAECFGNDIKRLFLANKSKFAEHINDYLSLKEGRKQKMLALIQDNKLSALHSGSYTPIAMSKANLIDGIDELPKFVTPSNGCIVIKGYFPTSKVVMLKVDGNWENSKYGYQLSVTSFTEIIPETKEGIIAYLSSFVYGMKDTTAKKIVDQFGLDTIKVFEETPEKLLEVRGIGRKKLKKIIESFSASRSIQDIVSYLAPYGITPNKCIKIAKEFGSEAMSVLTNEPFRLCEIDGFGFKTVDEIARKTTFELKDPLRIKGAIKFVIQNATNEGHLCLKQQEAIISAYLLLNQVDYTQNKVKKLIEVFLKDHNYSGILRQIVIEDVPLDCVVAEFKNMASLPKKNMIYLLASLVNLKRV